jgi:hypothetical protein
LEGATALSLHCIEGCHIGEVPIREGLIGQRPEVLSRLELRGVGGQEEEMDAVGDLDLLPGMPAGAIEHEEDTSGRSSPHIARKGGEHLTEEDCLHGGQEPPLGLAGGGTDEATDVEPFVPLLDGCDRSCANWSPDPADEGQQADPMLIGGPELDRCSRMGVLDLVYPIGELS